MRCIHSFCSELFENSVYRAEYTGSIVLWILHFFYINDPIESSVYRNSHNSVVTKAILRWSLSRGYINPNTRF